MSYFTAGKHRHKRGSKQSDASRALLTDPMRRSMVSRGFFSTTVVAEASEDAARELVPTADVLVVDADVEFGAEVVVESVESADSQVSDEALVLV